MNVARLVFPALRWAGRTPDQVWSEVHCALDLGVGGFVVFGGSLAGMREVAVRAREHAGRPVLFAADLERGAAQQFEGATPLPPPAALGTTPDVGLFESARITAQEAASAGVGWVLAPVADLDLEPANPIVGTRSFGSDPAAVADQVRGWVDTVQSEGIHACAKHFPGHGRTAADSHSELPIVVADREALAADLAPFQAAIEAGVKSVMLAHVVYPTLDPSGAPASLSPAIIKLLRQEFGFDGLVATDALVMEAVSASGRSEAVACVEAVRAGCDVLLCPSSAEHAVYALTGALETGPLESRRVAEAVHRVEAAAASASPVALDEPVTGSSYEEALDLAVATIRAVRGALPEGELDKAVRLHVIDDDLSPASMADAATDRGRLAEALEARGARLISPLSREEEAADLIALFSDVRAWKGRAWLAPESVSKAGRILQAEPKATLLLFGHPRLAEQLPNAANVVCAWNGDPLMQEAVAERMMRTPT